MRTMAVAILTPIFSGLIVTFFGMYIDVQEIKAKEPIRIRQLDRIEDKLDKITGYLIEPNSAKIIKKRGK